MTNLSNIFLEEQKQGILHLIGSLFVLANMLTFTDHFNRPINPIYSTDTPPSNERIYRNLSKEKAGQIFFFKACNQTVYYW